MGSEMCIRDRVDRGVFGHYPDDYTPGPRYKVFNDGQKVLTARGHQLRGNLFSVKQGTQNEVVPTFDKDNPRHLRAIGADAFVHIEWGTQTLALRVVEGRLVGHGDDNKCYHVYDEVARRIMESRDIVLLETPCLTPSGGATAFGKPSTTQR